MDNFLYVVRFELILYQKVKFPFVRVAFALFSFILMTKLKNHYYGTYSTV
jgi:hypothetical protein